MAPDSDVATGSKAASPYAPNVCVNVTRWDDRLANCRLLAGVFGHRFPEVRKEDARVIDVLMRATGHNVLEISDERLQPRWRIEQHHAKRGAAMAAREGGTEDRDGILDVGNERPSGPDERVLPTT